MADAELVDDVSDGQPIVLTATDVVKSFGETRALRGASLSLRRGEAHAIVGENGSGKSTFVKIVSGVLFADSGSVVVEGTSLGGRRVTPRAARALGVGTVFQEVLTIGSRSVLDNIWLGADGTFRSKLGVEEKRSRAAAVLAELVDSPPPLEALVETLELSVRQVCVVARAIVQRPKVLILDESTSSLDVSTKDRLFAVVRRLCAEGTSVIFTSHRMEEIEDLGDRVTVFRSGSSVATLERKDASTETLLKLMAGIETSAVWSRTRARRAAVQQPMLKATGVRLRSSARPVDFLIHAGEIVGLAGLEGHGQDEFLRVLVGVDRPLEGNVSCYTPEAREIRVTSQEVAASAGVAYVPRDRKTEGIFEPLSLLDNFSIPTLTTDGRLLIRERRRRRRFSENMKSLQTKYGSPSDRITTLSGGNQQKVVLARWLATTPSVIVLNDPTRGVDHRTKLDIYKLLEDLAGSGVAILMLSTEIEEHLALMDRVLIFRDASIFEEVTHDVLSRDRLIAGYFGESEAPGTTDPPKVTA